MNVGRNGRAPTAPSTDATFQAERWLAMPNARCAFIGGSDHAKARHNGQEKHRRVSDLYLSLEPMDKSAGQRVKKSATQVACMWLRMNVAQSWPR